ncbi:hypothetical protein F5B18DRAFT_600445 [Nemania serpens]|nr:hypothetical protein F5B18DRAFT_600445 [Nemania serpens]
MSHSRDRLEWNLQVAMQVYRTEKRMEGQLNRRDERETTVTCVVSGRVEGHPHGWACRRIAPVSLRPTCQPVREIRTKLEEDVGTMSLHCIGQE